MREARPEDAQAIARVHVDTWKRGYRGQIPDDYLDRLAFERFAAIWEQQLHDRSRDETNWVGIAGEDEIVGFAGGGRTRDVDAGDRTGEVFAIYVLPEHWGSGVGQALMDAASEWLRERFDSATLWVLDTNARARRFYEKCGWRFDGATRQDDRGSFVLNEVRYRVGL